MILAALLASLVMTPVKVELRDGKLFRNDALFQIKGVGGSQSLELLASYGGNSVRTWGADNAQALLDQAHKLGLTVTVGIWLGHKEHGFKYDDKEQVAKQLASSIEAVKRLKDHPALLMWGIGNEMEGYDAGGDPNVWAVVEEIAREIKKIDQNHPTMTVTAEIGGERVAAIHKLCPSIDVLGINSYGGAPSLPERYAKAGGTRPYVITEFGPLGQWEVGKTSWGAPREMTSTEKAAFYRRSYEANAQNPKCLGSYAFLWGNKQEATSTWFGILLKDGSRVAAADTMAELWSGKPPKNRVPVIEKLTLVGPETVAAGESIVVGLQASDPESDKLSVEWYLQAEQSKPGIGGQTEPIPPVYRAALIKGDLTGASFKAPDEKGAYRVFVVVKDGSGGAATGNIPILVR